MRENRETTCWTCENAHSMSIPWEETHDRRFVDPGPFFERWCTATAKNVKCVDRNTKGKCRWYKEGDSV